MVSRIEVIPGDVRGYGNIVEPKTTDDFTLYNAELSLSDGVYSLVAEALVDSITLTSNKTVLSYHDNENCTFTARLSNHAISETVQLYNANTNTLIGSMTSNNDGTYTYTYNSQGIGDLQVYAKWGNVTSSNITIEDCKYYFHGVDKSSDFTPKLCEGGTNGTVTYDSTDGVHFTHGSKATCYQLPVKLPENCIIEADFTKVTAGTYGIVLGNGTDGYADGCILSGDTIQSGYRYTNSVWQGSLISSVTHGGTLPFTMRVTKTGTSIYITVNNVSSNSFTMQFTSGDVYTGIIGNSSLNAYINGFKIKTV